ncbi:2-succinylbenzoate--CoA ligase [Okeania sp.]|uniref:2-succinylbenzoate--CoA ligase n=1 Tax=Okeania sp. TaxID=3100323 RepID=UPI002B4AB4AC|nr:2-succinylbenzoate--CoA ligase [Okeania sp.]MEB3343080.1 2-succinylbenzoate--CoA ligase [Okeania sp.]
MNQIFNYLKQYQLNRDNNFFLNSEFYYLAEKKFTDLIKIVNPETPSKVLISEPKPKEFLTSFIAAVTAGCQVFLCNPKWQKQEWEQVLKLVQPDIIFGNILNQKFPGENLEKTPNFPKHNPCKKTLSSEQNLIMIPTGGSSGKIKFAIHTWETLISSVKGFQEYFQVQKINSFCVLPLYHVSGLMQFMRSFTTGGNLVILPSYKDIFDKKEWNINPSEFFISLVPTQLKNLLQNAEIANWLSNFQTVLLGGAAAWEELFNVARKYQIKLAPTYGMTETASQVATLKPEDFLAGNNSNGQVLPHAKIIVQSESREILGQNQIGNIIIKANSLALGYYPNTFNNSESFTTDDLGFFDNQNYLKIVGRNSQKIITGGENVFPAEIEAAILRTGLVNDICVIGLKDKYWGEVVTAIYVSNNFAVSREKLLVAIDGKLSKFKQPKYWVRIESLPRNTQGKINRQLLKEIAIQRIKD